MLLYLIPDQHLLENRVQLNEYVKFFLLQTHLTIKAFVSSRTLTPFKPCSFFSPIVDNS